jgi:hypothetical protein
VAVLEREPQEDADGERAYIKNGNSAQSFRWYQRWAVLAKIDVARVTSCIATDDPRLKDTCGTMRPVSRCTTAVCARCASKTVRSSGRNGN